MTTNTITVRNSTYTVTIEAADNDKPRPALYNSRGQFAGLVLAHGERAAVIGGPSNWTGSECRQAARDALAALA